MEYQFYAVYVLTTVQYFIYLMLYKAFLAADQRTVIFNHLFYKCQKENEYVR